MLLGLDRETWGSDTIGACARLTLLAVCSKQHAQFRTRFTGKERDAETGLDYFGARYYGSSMGRFMSPDPITLTSAHQADPQQINLYSYVRNNPLIPTDPSGMNINTDDLNDKDKAL